MRKSSKDFLDLLFDPGETICISPNIYGYHSVGQEELDKDILLISPSEKVDNNTIKEEDINLIAMNPINGFRNDKNVTAYRTFLVELDDGTAKEQRDYIESIGMPYSVCVFSGNKSLHYGITVDKAFISESRWRTLAQWILNIVSKADPLTKNPSRSIRFPNNVRKDGRQLKQGLVEMRGRISREELIIWVNKFKDKKPVKKVNLYEEREENFVVCDDDMPDWLYFKLKEGVLYERNATWFKYACVMANEGFDLFNTISLFDQFFTEESDFNRKEWESVIESAYKTVKNK